MPSLLPSRLNGGQRSQDAARLLLAELLGQFKADLAEGMDWDAAVARLNTLYGRDLEELLAWATKAAAREPIEERFLAAVRTVFSAARDEVLAKLKAASDLSAELAKHEMALGNAVAADFLFDLGAFKDQLNYALRNVAASALQEAGQAQFAALGRDDVFTMPPPRAVRFLREREKRIEAMADDVFARVRDELQAGLGQGDSLAKLAARIEGEFTGLSRERAVVVAQTEAGAAYGVANDEAIRQADGGSGRLRKVWLTSGLPNTRHSHLEAARRSEQGIPLDQPFSNGLMYPGDETGPAEEVINCRCTLISREVET
ncbi:MAG: HK97 family phage portal protein [Limisphaerales bacterium]|nr:MAG: HK97 family phage portal protein [Limisphaerales bacterium]KAG0508092.1 MAG: HK97 family phage portal protein [Limisphaerales bacterium]TXT53055.1 MAG: HK97 family phage portal protein [Limisphaerales bacterium]